MVATDDGDFGWGAVVDFKKSANDTALEVAVSCVKGETKPLPPTPQSACEMRVVRVALNAVKDLSTIRVYLPKDLTGEEGRSAVSKTLGEVKRRLGVIPTLDPITDMKIEGRGIEALLERREALEARLSESAFHREPDRPARLALYSRKHDLGERSKLLRRQAREAQSPVMRDSMRRMQRVLRRLGFVQPSGVIDTKGRVACEVLLFLFSFFCYFLVD